MLNYEWERQSELEKMREQQEMEKKKEITKNLMEINERQRFEKEEQLKL